MKNEKLTLFCLMMILVGCEKTPSGNNSDYVGICDGRSDSKCSGMDNDGNVCKQNSKGWCENQHCEGYDQSSCSGKKDSHFDSCAWSGETCAAGTFVVNEDGTKKFVPNASSSTSSPNQRSKITYCSAHNPEQCEASSWEGNKCMWVATSGYCKRKDCEDHDDMGSCSKAKTILGTACQWDAKNGDCKRGYSTSSTSLTSLLSSLSLTEPLPSDNPDDIQKEIKKRIDKVSKAVSAIKDKIEKTPVKKSSITEQHKKEVKDELETAASLRFPCTCNTSCEEICPQAIRTMISEIDSGNYEKVSSAAGAGCNILDAKKVFRTHLANNDKYKLYLNLCKTIVRDGDVKTYEKARNHVSSSLYKLERLLKEAHDKDEKQKKAKKRLIESVLESEKLLQEKRKEGFYSKYFAEELFKKMEAFMKLLPQALSEAEAQRFSKAEEKGSFARSALRGY